MAHRETHVCDEGHIWVTMEMPIFKGIAWIISFHDDTVVTIEQ